MVLAKTILMSAAFLIKIFLASLFIELIIFGVFGNGNLRNVVHAGEGSLITVVLIYVVLNDKGKL